MERNRVISKLRAHQAELQAAGIVRLALFGSVARGDSNDQSDVDLMADFDKAKRLTLFSMSGLQLRIVDILGAPVDLTNRKMLKDQVKVRAEREAIVVF